ncbi:MAG: phosphatidylinositol-specific phospholipase C1-like protein [Polyangiales bacterium]
MKNRNILPYLLSLSFLVAGCSSDTQEQPLQMNEVQVLGTHNSYHIQPRDELLGVLRQLEDGGFADPGTADSLEYSALPLKEQFDHGVRQIELDIFADPEGGLYDERQGLRFIGQDPVAGLPELDEPGLKVLHVQDLDFETHCLTFKICLTTLKEWSDAHSSHLPITVMIEAKDEVIDNPIARELGFAIPIPFGPDEVAGIDDEILSVFPPDQLITPDDVRGEQDSLEDAVLNGGWPMLADARGRIMFVFLNGGTPREYYIEGHPSLTGRVMFTNSVRGEPEAAWFNVNNALNDGQTIRDLVADGYMVRTRADEDTKQARDDDYSLQEAAFASGGQYVSTDYVVPNPDFGTTYSAAVPGGYVARCNPISAPADCDSSRIRP